MAKNSKRVAESSSPPSSSQPEKPELIGEDRIQRLVYRIPKSQRELLGDNNSWAQVLRGTSMPFLNVPPEVLENLKKWYSRQLQATQSNESVPSPDPQPSTLSRSAKAGSPLQNTRPGSAAEDDDDENSSQNSSWTPSPVEHLHPPKRTTSESIKDAEDNEDTDDDEQPQFMTQPPMSSPRPTIPPITKLKAPLIFPPSSQEQEEPLEIEVPAAIHDTILPVNKSAVQTNNTPPSAQIVPCTFDQSAVRKPFQKQRIYNEPPAFYRPPKNETALKHHLQVRSTRQPDSSYPDAQSSTSTANISSSIIPSTIRAEDSSKDLPTWRVNTSISPSRTSPTTGNKRHGAPDFPPRQQHSPEYRPPSPLLMSSPSIQRSPRLLPLANTQQVSPSRIPFIHYTITYPNYNGSVGDFVTACMYIQLQQRRIRTSLYDDFIRAWHEGYIPYVRECDDSKPPTKALNAIDWYNDIDEDPLFTSRVITRQNLKSTLEFYPDELRFARSLLGVSPKPTPEATSDSVTTRLIENHKPSAENAPRGDGDMGGDNPNVPKKTPSKVGSIAVPVTNISALPRQQQKTGTLPFNRSMSEMEKRPTATREFVRSYSEAAHHKRKASEDIAGAPSKRLSVNSLPKSDSGSVTSVNSEVPKSTRQDSVAPGSTSGRKKKFANDPERRTEQFKKFLKKREQGKKDSITSSAPGGNTPTSAQRE
ncbi:hypothetical protein F4818DRAFT_430210 [Hypoxylon cercidicola]|nr:hypothetical protein F4818DRAFT_430210 [Hypoxylon cercidicola]